MMRPLLILVFTLTIFPLALAAPPVPADEIGKFIQKDELKTYRQLQEYTDYKFAAGEFQEFPIAADLVNSSYRSPGKAFLYSVALPGAGQIYNHSAIKAGLFIGFEVASWVGWYIYQDKGQKQTDQNNNFADENWSAQLYTDWLIETYGIASDTDEFINDERERDHFTHHLPATKTQQYYEMIGKYDQFQYGWTDNNYQSGFTASPNRKQYLDDRAIANDFFSKAKTGAIVAIVNHLLSATDAAWSAKRHNRKQDTFSQMSLRAKLVRYEGHQMPKLILTYSF